MKKIILVLLFLALSAFAKVNVNSATKDELMSLKGIGPAKAEAIINYRKTNAIKSVDDLKNIKGIGDGIVSKIKDEVSFSGSTVVNTSSAKKSASTDTKDTKKEKKSKKEETSTKEEKTTKSSKDSK